MTSFGKAICVCVSIALHGPTYFLAPLLCINSLHDNHWSLKRHVYHCCTGEIGVVLFLFLFISYLYCSCFEVDFILFALFVVNVLDLCSSPWCSFVFDRFLVFSSFLFCFCSYFFLLSLTSLFFTRSFLSLMFCVFLFSFPCFCYLCSSFISSAFYSSLCSCSFCSCSSWVSRSCSSFIVLCVLYLLRFLLLPIFLALFVVLIPFYFLLMFNIQLLNQWM